MDKSLFRWNTDESSKLTPFRKFMAGDYALGIEFLAALIIISLNAYIPGALLFGVLLTVTLLLSDDLVSTFPIFMLALCFVIQAENTYNQFIVYLPIIIAPVLAGIVHAYVYRNDKMGAPGMLYLPMILVSITVLLGGLGTITMKEYFSTTSLSYMFALGFMIVIIYRAFSGHIGPGKNYTEKMDERIAKLFCAVALFLILASIEGYIEHIDAFKAHPGILYFQWRNNGCTLLMMAMPFSFYMATKKFPYIWIAFGSVLAFVLLGSRGGMILGGLEFLILFVLFWAYDREHRTILGWVIGSVLLIVAFGMPKLMDLLSYTSSRFTDASQYSIRLGLWRRSITDFKTNPIFGRGLGYMGNRDLHPSKTATLCWYHSSLPQVWGSFGLTGIAAYGYQLYMRFKFFREHRSLFGRAVFASFLGLELMSLVNPGIFAPVYLVIITVLFVVVEQYPYPNMDLKIVYSDPIEPASVTFENDRDEMA